jgi:hypothetical protein
MLHHQIWLQGDNMLHHLSFSSISNITMPAAHIPDDKVVDFLGVQDFIERHIFHKKREWKKRRHLCKFQYMMNTTFGLHE